MPSFIRFFIAMPEDGLTIKYRPKHIAYMERHNLNKIKPVSFPSDGVGVGNGPTP